MGADVPKQFMLLGDKPVLVHTLDAFHRADPAMGLVVVLPEAHIEMWTQMCKEYATPPHIVAPGGATRYDSVASGLAAVPAEAEVVGVHDGVRPFVNRDVVCRCFAEAAKYGSAVPVIAPVDSFRRVKENGTSEIADRSALRAVQTPQVFDAALLRRAYAEGEGGAGFTDDASVVEALGVEIHLTEGDRLNIKITTPEDMVVGRAVLDKRLCD